MNILLGVHSHAVDAVFLCTIFAYTVEVIYSRRTDSFKHRFF